MFQVLSHFERCPGFDKKRYVKKIAGGVQDAQLLNLAIDVERMNTQYFKKRKSYICVNIWGNFEDDHFKFVVYFIDRYVCYQKAESHALSGIVILCLLLSYKGTHKSKSANNMWSLLIFYREPLE